MVTKEMAIEVRKKMSRYNALQSCLRMNSMWKVFNKEGISKTTINLREFCRENDLQVSHLIRTQEGMDRKWHKGWRVEKVPLPKSITDKIKEKIDILKEELGYK